MQRIRHAAAVTPRVQVLRRRRERELEPAEPAARHRERRLVDAPHRAVRRQHDIGREQLSCSRMNASRWRLPISSSPSNMNFTLTGRRAGSREERLGDLDRDQHRSLVVGHAAGVEAAVAHGRRERRALPLLQRVRRLHVVVPVHQHRRLARRAEPLGVDDGIAGGGIVRTANGPAAATRRDPRAARSMSAACAGSVLTLGIEANSMSSARMRS